MKKYETFKAKFNSDEIVKKLYEIEKKTGNLKPMLRVVRSCLLEDIQENFDTEGEASGEKWKELSTDYDAWKKEHTDIDKILQFWGDLRSKMISKVSDRSVIIGSAQAYAAVHNFGSEDGSTPQREFMRFSDYQLEEVVAEIEYWYLKNVKYFGVK